MQERNWRLGAWFVATAMLFAAGAAGCGKSSPPPVTVTSAGLAGTWIEFVEKVDTSDPRVASPPELKVFRKLTINEDGTYSMVLLDKRQKPIEGAKAAGTWAVAERTIEFTAGENTLKGSDAELAPADASGVIQVDGEDRLMISDQNGWQGTFKRAS